jgi:hypothetical protein
MMHIQLKAFHIKMFQIHLTEPKKPSEIALIFKVYI